MLTTKFYREIAAPFGAGLLLAAAVAGVSLADAEAGNGAGPMPLKVPSEQLPKMLGVTSIKIMRHPLHATLSDATLA